MFRALVLLLATASIGSDAFVTAPSGVNNAHRTRLQDTTAASADVAQSSSAATFSGAGPIQVDMNAYNLPLDVIAQEWTANLLPASAMQEEGIYLGAKSSKANFVDTLKIEIPRRMNEGLGIQLLEIAGGREDGYGITVVDGLVEGGCAENSGIMVGDSISMIEVVRKTKADSKTAAVSIECLGYDATVDEILSLPPQESSDETVMLTIKRLRRKPKVTVNLQYPPEQGESDISLELFSGENLRRAFLVRGVKLNDPLSRRFDSGGTGDCGAEGTCATCSVSIVDGMDLLSPPGTTEQQILAENPRWRMSCRAIVGYGMKEGEMTVRVSPKRW